MHTECSVAAPPQEPWPPLVRRVGLPAPCSLWDSESTYNLRLMDRKQILLKQRLKRLASPVITSLRPGVMRRAVGDEANEDVLRWMSADQEPEAVEAVSDVTRGLVWELRLIEPDEERGASAVAQATVATLSIEAAEPWDCGLLPPR